MNFSLLAVAAFVVMVWRMGYLWSRGPRARKAFERGIAALQTNDLVEAETAFRTVVGLEPIWAVAQRLLGRVLAERGKTEEAEKHFRNATTLEPRNPDGYADLGFFLAVKADGRQEDAITAFTKAVELAPRLREELAKSPALGALLTDERFRRLLAAEEG